MSKRGRPTTHSSAPRDRAPGVEQDVEALVGPHQAEAEHDRRRRLGQLGRQRRRRPRREVRERPVRDHVDALRRRRPSSSDQALARRAPSGRSRASKRRSRRRMRRAAAGRGPSARAGARAAAAAPSSAGSASHWKWTRSAARGRRAQGEHVRHVLGELRARAAAAIPGAPRARAVEALAAQVAVGRRRRRVREAARDQLDLDAGARERRAQRVVVGRRVGRGVDDVHLHRTPTIRGWPSRSPSASSTPAGASC